MENVFNGQLQFYSIKCSLIDYNNFSSDSKVVSLTLNSIDERGTYLLNTTVLKKYKVSSIFKLLSTFLSDNNFSEHV